MNEVANFNNASAALHSSALPTTVMMNYGVKKGRHEYLHLSSFHSSYVLGPTRIRIREKNTLLCTEMVLKYLRNSQQANVTHEVSF